MTKKEVAFIPDPDLVENLNRDKNSNPFRDGFVLEIARARVMLKAAVAAYTSGRHNTTISARLRSARRHIEVAKDLLDQEQVQVDRK